MVGRSARGRLSAGVRGSRSEKKHGPIPGRDRPAECGCMGRAISDQRSAISDQRSAISDQRGRVAEALRARDLFTTPGDATSLESCAARFSVASIVRPKVALAMQTKRPRRTRPRAHRRRDGTTQTERAQCKHRQRADTGPGRGRRSIEGSSTHRPTRTRSVRHSTTTADFVRSARNRLHESSHPWGHEPAVTIGRNQGCWSEENNAMTPGSGRSRG